MQKPLTTDVPGVFRRISVWLEAIRLLPANAIYS